MDPNLLASLFGSDGRWSGSCTVILDAIANIQSIGSDAIVQGGIKTIRRMITGRVPAITRCCCPTARHEAAGQAKSCGRARAKTT